MSRRSISNIKTPIAEQARDFYDLWWSYRLIKREFDTRLENTGLCFEVGQIRSEDIQDVIEHLWPLASHVEFMQGCLQETIDQLWRYSFNDLRQLPDGEPFVLKMIMGRARQQLSQALDLRQLLDQQIAWEHQQKHRPSTTPAKIEQEDVHDPTQ